MTDETAKYRLSVYQSRELIRETPNCRIEKVFSTLNEKTYIMRTYPEDKRELFRALKKIENEHIPQIIEIIFHENTTVIEQYIQGRKLSGILENDQITTKRAHKLARQIFEAVNALHYVSIIHRDIKPDNILVDESNAIWLIDFGIARLYDKTARHDTQHFGTIGYAPPEQFGFSQSDFRSDLYAAGVTIEEMGKAAGCSTNSAIMKAAKRCREFDPNRRYASANAVLREINSKQCRIIAILVVALLAVAVGILYGYFHTGWFVKRNEHTDAWASEKNQDSQAASLGEPKSEMEDDNKDENNVGWIDIINISSLETAESIPYIPILPDAESVIEKVCLAKGQSEIEIQYKLSGDTLNLILSDSILPEQGFTFSYDTATMYQSYKDTTVEAEIMFYDMNGDGQYELLVALSDRKRFTNPSDILFCNTNSLVVWCIGYAKDEGFWQTDGMIGPTSQLTLGNGILLDGLSNETTYLLDRAFVCQ